MSENKTGCCSITCPAIRDDKGTFWCRIKQECVAPFEKRDEYGFDIVSEGKIKKSGYHTECRAMEIFSRPDKPRPPCEERIYQAQSAQERERILNLLDGFTKDAIKICDSPHGNLSNPMKVKGMKAALVIIEGVIKQFRTEEGIKLFEDSSKKGEP